jgi:elongation factor Ts
MAITAADVKKLKDMTNAGMMDCKKALEDANGNFDEALKILKEKGLADAKKRSDRETKEGGVYILENAGKIGAILLGCETDFVSGNDLFKQAKDKILKAVIAEKNESPDHYKDYVQEVISATKENIELKKVKYIELKAKQTVQTYIHGNNKIGVIAVFELGDDSAKNKAEFKEMAADVCLHITASSPFYISDKDVPAKEIDEQKEIFLKQMEGSGKPANIVENIINGKIQKHLAEICLLDQKFVKDDKITVKAFIDGVSKKLGTEIKLISFTRWMVGA